MITQTQAKKKDTLPFLKQSATQHITTLNIGTSAPRHRRHSQHTATQDAMAETKSNATNPSDVTAMMMNLPGLTDRKAYDIAVNLRDAMKGLGTDDKVLVENLAPLNSRQAQEVAAAYTRHIQRDLIADIKSETSRNFRLALEGILTPPLLYDAQLVKKAIKGLGTKEDLLIDTICTRTPNEIEELAGVYRKENDSFMAQDICDDLSGDFKTLFTVLLNTDRTKSPPDSQIDDDVLRLYKAGEGKLGTNEKVFINILGGYPREYIRKIANAYAKKYGKLLTKVIKDEFGKNMERALIALVQEPHEYFADRLYEAMKGAGTSDEVLVYVIVTQRDRHLKRAAEWYLKTRDISLAKAVEKETSGDYRATLLTIIKNVCE